MPSQRDIDFIFGLRPVMEAVNSGKEVNKMLLQKGAKGDLMQGLFKLIRDHSIPFQYVPEEKLNRITKKNHQGVICYISPIPFQGLEFIVSQTFEEGKVPLLLVLDRVTDVRNFGAICRTAECMGVHAVVVPKKGAALINADAIKTSAGALHKLPICREENLKETIENLSNSGLQIMACTEQGDKSPQDVDLTIPLALLVGSEEDGISPAYLKLCNEQLALSMKGSTASLNVGVAAGMLLYEVDRQRG